MRALFLATALLSTSLAVVPAMALTPVAIEQPAGAYVLDRSHASVIWRVSHLGVSMYAARFDRFGGELNFDPKDPSKSALTATIDATSVNTGYPGEKDFSKEVADKALGADKHPEIKFVSTAIALTGERTGTVTGNLTFNGVTKPTTLNVTFVGGGTNPRSGKPLIGFSAKGSIKRSDFGSTQWAPFIGDTVELDIDAEFAGK